jgi:hypothetical protein
MSWPVIVSKLCTETSNIGRKIVKIVEVNIFICVRIIELIENAAAGLFVLQRTCSHSTGISCTAHELFCP